MKKHYVDNLKSEKSVELPFIQEMLHEYGSGKKVLDVGGTPTHGFDYGIHRWIEALGGQHKIADLVGPCDYKGDFVTYDFKDEKFDIIMFLSSIEHFPQATEGDMIYRYGYDRSGFRKALSILKDKGIILLTVPFGKPVWQDYHQNYDWELLMKLIEGTILFDGYTYILDQNVWVQTPATEMDNIVYTDKCYGVGCFICYKEVI